MRIAVSDTETRAASVHEAITAAKQRIGAVGKGDRNTDQGWMFRGVDAVLNAVAPALREHGLTVAPIATSYQYEQIRVGKDSRLVGHVIVTVTYRWTGPAGDHLDIQVIAEAMDAGDKAAAKAMSVAYRTCLLQTLSLPTGEPTDPDHHTYDRADPDAVVHPRTAAAVAAVDQAVAADDAAWLERIRRSVPAAALSTLADPATGRDLATYLDDATTRITHPAMGSACRCDPTELAMTGRRACTDACPSAPSED